MPSSTPQPERSEPTDEERFDNYTRDIIAEALTDSKPFLRRTLTDPSRTPEGINHDIHAVARTIITRLKREGLRVTPAEETDSLL